MRTYIPAALGAAITLAIATFFLQRHDVPLSVDPSPVVSVSASPAPASPEATAPSTQNATAAPATVGHYGLVEPLPDFLSRVSKKYFGTYVSPGNSPVSPEKFTGHHAGIDAEAADVPAHTAVKAVAAGTVTYARRVNGYGGVAMVRSTIDGTIFTVLYGHLYDGQLPAVGTEVAAGDTVGVLGAGGTSETDGERQHLHLAFIKGESSNVRGYVSTEDALDAWADPLPYFK